MTLASAFAGIKESKTSQLAKPGIQLAGKPESQKAGSAAGKLAKSSDPEFRQVNVYLRKATVKAAARKWEDAEAGDFSDLVEKLLADYLAS
jgi:hypothetical protein